MNEYFPALSFNSGAATVLATPIVDLQQLHSSLDFGYDALRANSLLPVARDEDLLLLPDEEWNRITQSQLSRMSM